MANESALNKEQIKQQIIEENEFTLMCRDVVDLVRLFFNFYSTQTTLALNSSSSKLGSIDMEESEEANENMENMENDNNKSTTAKLGPKISDLAQHLLKTNPVIYESSILLLFEGLYWPDSNCSQRLVRIAQALFERFQLIHFSQTQTFSLQYPGEFFIYLNENVCQKLFNCCLNALQVHGEHSEISSLLTNLAFLIYTKVPVDLKNSINGILMNLPNLNMKQFEEFVQKVQKCSFYTGSVNQSLTNSMQSQTQANDKLVKDLFKKLLQPIIGKSIGQLYSNEIKIRVLQPLNIRTKKSESRLNDFNSREVNICSLFDPENNGTN